VWDKGLLRKMASFAGWQLCGTTSYTLTHNGLNMLLNTFGGTIVNAARGIAYQAFAAVNQFIINLQLVLSPLSTKLYASESTNKMFQLFYFTSKIMFLTLNCVVLPIVFFTKEILRIWLGTVPDYSVDFIRLLMIYSVIRALHSPVDTLLKSVGRIKRYQITESIILAIPLLLSYIALKFDFKLYWVFIFVLIMETVNMYMILLLAKRETRLDLTTYFKRVFIPIATCFIIEFFLFGISGDSVLSNFISLVLSEIIVIMVIYLYSFTTEEKRVIVQLLSRCREKILRQRI
jgi:O-antigen/teichoic acid export membrane protein